MYHVSLGVLAAAFQHGLCKASTATRPQWCRHLCTAAPPTIPFLCSDPRAHWDTRLYAGYLWSQRNSLKHTQFHHPEDGFGCCNACLPQVKCSTPSLPFHSQREKKTFPFSMIKKPEIADHIGYRPSATLYTSAGINVSALPLYSISAFSVGSCFLAAALR